MSTNPIRIFVSYAHLHTEEKYGTDAARKATLLTNGVDDEAVVMGIRDNLSRYLANGGFEEFWYDRELFAGEGWRGKIEHQMRISQIILLIVSPGFSASNFINDVERPQAFLQKEAGHSIVIPVWSVETSVSDVGDSDILGCNCVPRDMKWISRINADKANLLTQVSDEIIRTIEKLKIGEISLNTIESDSVESPIYSGFGSFSSKGELEDYAALVDCTEVRQRIFGEHYPMNICSEPVVNCSVINSIEQSDARSDLAKSVLSLLSVEATHQGVQPDWNREPRRLNFTSAHTGKHMYQALLRSVLEEENPNNPIAHFSEEKLEAELRKHVVRRRNPKVFYFTIEPQAFGRIRDFEPLKRWCQFWAHPELLEARSSTVVMMFVELPDQEDDSKGMLKKLAARLIGQAPRKSVRSILNNHLEKFGSDELQNWEEIVRRCGKTLSDDDIAYARQLFADHMSKHTVWEFKTHVLNGFRST